MGFGSSTTNTGVLLLAVSCISHAYADDLPVFHTESYQQAYTRLKAVYESDEFRAKRFDAKWLDDSSGYALRVRNVDSGSMEVVRYEVESGKRIAEVNSGSDRNRFGEQLSPDGRLVLESRGRQVFVRDLNTDQKTQLTPPIKSRDLSHRGAVWSPDGKYVAFIQSDSTDVRQRSVLVPSDPSYPDVSRRRFARVGGKIDSLKVGIVEPDGTNLKWLPIPMESDGCYLGQVEWAENSGELLVEVLSRFRDKREFFLAGTDGSVESIYKEVNPAWAVGSQEKNLGLTWVEGGEAFVVVSEKDGWRHAFLHSRSGEERALLTPGEYDIIDRAFVDEVRGIYYFYASPENGTQSYLYRVPLDGGGTPERVTPDSLSGTHTYEFSPDGSYAFHTYSSMDVPPVVDLVKLPEHRTLRVLEDNSELAAKMKSLVKHPTEFLELQIEGGISMDAWMMKPADFDPSASYPVFVYVYGEPYAQTVLDKWGGHHAEFHRTVADQGYLVVSIDNRGTPAPKGAEWRRSVFGSLGPLSTEEQAAGVKELGRARSYVDLSRVGIWGWSGGGSNTLNAMFRKPDTYHVGIAVVPKPQPHLYNAWFQEIYMRTREVNPDGYRTGAAMTYADGLKGHLLIITGSGETNTHIQIIEGLVDLLIELGKPFDYMVYPNRDHGLREGPGSSLHVRMLILRYLLTHLPAGPR